MPFPSIAIVGAACRFPQAPDLDAFSQLLFDRRDAVTVLPRSRLAASAFFDPDPHQPGKSYTFAAGALDAVGEFDAGYFGMSPREAVHVDPQQRLLLELALEAVEDAGLVPGSSGMHDVAVFAGGSSWDYSTFSVTDTSSMDAYSMQGAALSSLANRISYLFDFRGPSLTVDTACSSSLVALHLACEAIRRDEVPMALACGVNLLLAPNGFIGFSRASMLSKRGRCQAFDAKADGYVRGEGGAVVVLKRLDAALADGDDIRGVILASGVNSDGRTNGFSLPNGAAQAALLREVYARAEVAPDDLAYLEAHGTGTQAGDRAEAGSIGEVIGRHRRSRLPIGSVKTNIGHLEPASGLAGLLKLLVSFQAGAVPPSLHCETPNPDIPFAALNLEVATTRRPLVVGPRGLVAGVNSFGFGGTNAHAVVAGPVARRNVAAETGGRAPPLVLSARSEPALRALAGRWQDRIERLTPDALTVALRGAARKRRHHPHRLALPVPNPSDLQAWLDGRTSPRAHAGHAVEGSIAFVFSGNGSQWSGMALDALRGNAMFRETIDAVDAELRPHLGWSVAARLAEPVSTEALRDTATAQPLLFAVQVAVSAALRDAGIEAASHVGHSAGEVAAAWASGALTLPQAARVIAERSLKQQATHGHGGMAVLGLPAEDVTEVLASVDGGLVVAAINGPEALTVAGSETALDLLASMARQQNWLFSRLELDYAFHSRAMDPIRDRLLTALAGLSSAETTAPLVSTVTGEPVAAGDLDAEYWWRNVRHPVLFARAIDRLIAQGARILIEIGPHPVLQSYLRDGLRRADSTGRVLSTLTRRPVEGDPFAVIAARAYAAGADIGGAAVFAGDASCRNVPAYPWQREQFWLNRTVEATELANPRFDHPLLGHRRGSASSRWIGHLSLGLEPWLRHHVVDGSIVFPAAAMIEMALAAGRIRHADAPSVELTDLEIARPMILDPDLGRELLFDITDSKGGFSLASRPRLAVEDPVRHLAGRIAAGAASTLAPHSSPATADQILDGPSVYAAAAARRLDYGPAFRTVRRVTITGPGTAVVAFDPAAPHRVDPAYLVDPATLDGAFQGLLVLAGLRADTAAGTLLPWRFERITWAGPAGSPIGSARLTVVRVGPRSVAADIALVGTDGATVMTLDGCWFAALASANSDRTRVRRFSTGLLPSLRQPDMGKMVPLPGTVLPVVIHRTTETTAERLDGFIARAAFDFLVQFAKDHPEPLDPEALAIAGVIDRPTAARLEDMLGWASSDGLAERVQGGWRLASGDPTRPAKAIWQSLFHDAPTAIMEASAVAAATASFDESRTAPALAQQLATGSPSAATALDALDSSIEQWVEAYPADRPLRAIQIGWAQGAAPGRLADTIAARHPASRYVLAVPSQDEIPAARDLLTGRPQATVRVVSPDLEMASNLVETFDLVIACYPESGLAGPVMGLQALRQLAAPGGTVLGIEPGRGRMWPLLFPGAPVARLASGEPARVARLAAAGFTGAAEIEVTGGAWPVMLFQAQAPGRIAEVSGQKAAKLEIFRCGDAPWTAAVDGIHDVPLEALPATLGAAADRGARALIVAIGCGGGTMDALAEQVAALTACGAQLVEYSGLTLWLVLDGGAGNQAAGAITGVARVLRNEAVLDCRVISVDPGLTAEIAAAGVAAELADPDGETEISLVSVAMGGTVARYVPRLDTAPTLVPQPTGPLRLAIPRPGRLSALAWESVVLPAPTDDEVAIEVQAAGLNFRDVMWAMGLLPDEALLDGFSGPGLGLECAGVVRAVGGSVTDLVPGDRVVAVAPSALATEVVTKRHAVMKLPDEIDFASAATIPVTFLTVVYALGTLARLQPGERVLIHGAAGGVGLAAIQYAKHLGAEVFATAGSEVKRTLIRMLDVEHVFDSRDAHFASAILDATGGEGVDCVLNSLSGPLMEASLRLLRPFGRFLEIGKRDLYENSQVGLRPLRHNVSYFAIDADELAARRPALATAVLAEIETLLRQGVLRPLPHRVFSFAAAGDAFRLLQASGHIGKIVLAPTDERLPMVAAPARLALREDATYIVTGGLSGFGLETARWLARRGAKSLALIGRRGNATAGAAAAIEDLGREGAVARAFACDVADEPALDRTLRAIRRELGPIAGVFHAAALIDDARLADQTADRIKPVLRTKLHGAELLDRLTREDPIELFVLFSSVTTVLGNPGQANYVAANAGLEALAWRRLKAGLPALAVQWGPVGDAGHLARELRVSEALAGVLGSEHPPAASMLDALPELLRSGQPVAGLAGFDWAQASRHLPSLATPLFGDVPRDAVVERSGKPLLEELRSLTASDARARMVAILSDELSQILKIPSAAIEPDRRLSELGMDSLMALELRMAIEGRIGIDLPLLSLSDGTTLKAVAERLLRGLGPTGEPARVANAAAPDVMDPVPAQEFGT